MTNSPTITSGHLVHIYKAQTLKAYAVKVGMTDSALFSAAHGISGGTSPGLLHTIVLKSDGTVVISCRIVFAMIEDLRI